VYGYREEHCMNKRPPRIKKAEYPDETIGSKLAIRARKIANSLTAEERLNVWRGQGP